MEKLLFTLKSVSVISLGMVSVSAFLLLATFLVMPESLPHVAAQWFFVLAGGTAGILVTVTAALHVFMGWQEANAENSRRLLSNHNITNRSNGSTMHSDSVPAPRPYRQPVRE